MKNKIEKVFNYLTILIVILLFFKCAMVVMVEPFSFDGGMNAQAAHNLIKGFSHGEDYYGMSIFDPKIQTGIPVILPVAINFLLLGESFSSGLLVNAVYLIMLMIAVIYYFKTCLKINNLFTFLVILVLYATPSLFDFGFGLYGEIPAIFYFIISLIFLHKYHDGSRMIYILLSGSFLGLGYLTKTVILITIPAFVLVAILDGLINPSPGIKRFFQSQGIFALGFVAPISIFEVFKLFSLGIGPYGKWWNTMLTAVLMQAGVSEGFADTTGIATKFVTHLDLLSSYIGINKWIISVGLCFLTIFFIMILVRKFQSKKGGEISREIREPASSSFLILLTTALSYFGWWLLITTTQKAWHRRIINGTILFEICLIVLFYLGYKFILNKMAASKQTGKGSNKSLFITLFVSLLLIGSIVSLIRSPNTQMSVKDSDSKLAYIHAGNYIKNLPKEALVFGFGWWQAPIVSFTSSRDFTDLYQYRSDDWEPSGTEAFLVIDTYAFEIDPDASRIILDQYENKLVFVENDIYIYKLLDHKRN